MRAFAFIFGGLLALFCAWLAFLACDFLFLDDSNGTAKVFDKSHTDAWVQTIITSDGKNTSIQTIYHPESWRIIFSKDDDISGLEVREGVYSATNLGDVLPVTFRKGRFTHGVYITSIIR